MEFVRACKNRDLETAERLYSLGVDIHAKDYAFRSSCEREHFEIAKCLHSLGANIHADDEYAFIYSCENGV